MYSTLLSLTASTTPPCRQYTIDVCPAILLEGWKCRLLDAALPYLVLSSLSIGQAGIPGLGLVPHLSLHPFLETAPYRGSRAIYSLGTNPKQWQLEVGTAQSNDSHVLPTRLGVNPILASQRLLATDPYASLRDNNQRWMTSAQVLSRKGRCFKLEIRERPLTGPEGACGPAWHSTMFLRSGRIPSGRGVSPMAVF